MSSLRQEFEGDVDFAFIEMGLSEADFFRQTPREWQRRVEAWKFREERADIRVARLCCCLVGGTIAEHMPAHYREPEEPQTIDEMFAVLDAVSKQRK